MTEELDEIVRTCPECAIEFRFFVELETSCPYCGTELIGEEDML